MYCIYILYKIYYHINKIKLLDELNNIIINLDKNVAIDILKYCNCDYHILMNDDKYYPIINKKNIECYYIFVIILYIIVHMNNFFIIYKHLLIF